MACELDFGWELRFPELWENVQSIRSYLFNHMDVDHIEVVTNLRDGLLPFFKTQAFNSELSGQEIIDMLVNMSHVFERANDKVYCVASNVIRQILKLLRKHFEMSDCFDSVVEKSINAEEVNASLKKLLNTLRRSTTSEINTHLLSRQFRPEDTILTFGNSSELLRILCSLPSEKRKVMVCHTAPSMEGLITAEKLSLKEDGSILFDTYTIKDEAVFAAMKMVDKVVIPVKTVFPDGGVLTAAGGHALALAAKHHNVPVICVASSVLLSHRYAHDQNSFNENCVAPESTRDLIMDEVEVINPSADYINFDLISLFIMTNNFNMESESADEISLIKPTNIDKGFLSKIQDDLDRH